MPAASPAGLRSLAPARYTFDQILSWDNALFRKDLGLLPNALQKEVRAALKEFLDL